MTRTTTATRRLLLVSYHLGVDGATGGFRWAAMLGDLVEAGWTVDVITATPAPTLPSPDLRSQVHIVHVPSTEGTSLPSALLRGIASLRRRLRRRDRSDAPAAPPAVARHDNPAPVDPARAVVLRAGHRRPPRAQAGAMLSSAIGLLEERAWAHRAARAGIALARQQAYAAVVVSTPPHATQAAGARIARSAGIPYVADLRDPWVLGIGDATSIGNPLGRTIGLRLERAMLRDAAAVVRNTPAALRAARTDPLGRPAHADFAIPNGTDAIGAEPGPPDPRVFRVLYAGWLHPFMDVRVLLSACGRLRVRHGLRADEYRVEFLGAAPEFGGVPLRGLAVHYGLGDVFEFFPRRSRAEAVAMQEQAAVLAAFDCTHELCIPAKFFDYIRMRGGLLLIGHPRGAMAEAAAELGLSVHAPSDEAAIDRTFDALLAKWRAGQLVTANDPDGRFARRHRSAEWHALLDRIASTTHPPRTS